MSKTEILFGLGVMLVGACLAPFIGYGSALVGLVVGLGLIAAGVYGRKTNAEMKEFFKALPRATTIRELPKRAVYHRSMSSSRVNPDGSVSIDMSVARQIDSRPKLWEGLSASFKEIEKRPMPVCASWIYTCETKDYQWWIRHPSEVAVKLCAELCKEAGRLLLADPDFRSKFPEVAAVTDDGDRWLLGIYKIAGIGKAQAHGTSVSEGTTLTTESGRIEDVPGASQVLCRIALNGF